MFAFNSEVNYVAMAERTARLAKHILNVPATLITEGPVKSTVFDTVISVDNTLDNFKPGQTGQWRNGDRYRAYELSPYDQTILIDSDYLILDKSLSKLLEQTFDYRIMTHNQKPDEAWNETMGANSLQYQWATVILFNKTDKSKMLFDLVGRIQRNYTYYSRLYHIRGVSFRNDYAFTIANNILNGYEPGMQDGIPWKMLTFANEVTSIQPHGSLIAVKEKDKAHLIAKQNMHIMDKKYLLSDDFSSFVEFICQDE